MKTQPHRHQGWTMSSAEDEKDVQMQVTVQPAARSTATPIGEVEVIQEEIRVEDFEAMRRSFNRPPAIKRKRTKMETEKPMVVVPAVPSEAEMHAFQTAKEMTLTPKTEAQEIILAGQERSIFHGPVERDYLGRTYMSVPAEAAMRGSFECFAPKKLIHTWTGHTRGVTAIRFFPTSGHLLLSASQDSRVKLWNVHGDRQCLRTFLGHNKPVRDVNFDSDGRHFVSAGYDKCLKHWDTETGKCLLAIEHSAIPFCAKFHPSEPYSLLAGCSDKKIVQWDLRSGEIVQEYAQHLEAVNTITFFEEGRKFVSTGDDKTIRVWDYGIPVTVKAIAEPGMHAMPAAALHPSGHQILFQSLDNRLIPYACSSDRFQQRGRKFGGHSTAGYACNIGFSPDGKYVVSGSSGGQAVVWEARTGQVVRRLEAHAKVCIDVQWNPREASRLATCSWDGTIKYWD